MRPKSGIVPGARFPAGAVLCGLKLWTGLSARSKKGNCCQGQEDEGFLCCSGLVEQSDDSCPGLLGRESGDAG